MALTELKLEYEIASENKKGIPVIIAAAGSSSRMAGVNKQFADLCGIPVIIRTLLAFQRSDAISRIIVVTSKDSINEIQLLCSKYMIDKLTDILEGGANRAESVKKGVARLGEEGYVLIHDGARPCITKENINCVIEKVKESKACVAGMPVKDTIKIVDEQNNIVDTPNRKVVWMAQTPQAFSREIVVKAYEEMMKIGDNTITDDAMVVEKYYGIKVEMVECSYNNIKVTTPEDTAIAEAFLCQKSKMKKM